MNTNMTEQRQHTRFQVEFPATFSGDHTGRGIVYNLGIDDCKAVSDLEVKRNALLTMPLQVPKQTFAITIQSVAVRWTMEMERNRLEQFLATQENIVT